MPRGRQGGSAKRAEGAGAAGAPGGGPGVRVIVVGRTGLDAKLRLDPGVELVRVRAALDAIGELSEPSEGCSRVVILGRGAQGLEEGAGLGGVDGFVDALRRVDPGARLLRIDRLNGEAGRSPAFDGEVASDASTEALRAVIHGGGSEEAEAAPAPREESATAGGMPAPQDGVGDAEEEEGAWRAELADQSLARLLLQGRDVTDAALDVLRRRLEGRDVVYVSAGRTGHESPAPAPASEGENEAPVSWRGQLLGRLRSREVAAADLALHASWLASWLALRDQHVQLREAAFTDSLTGAHNRRFFDHFLGAAIEQVLRERSSLTLLMFDIDNFKSFNDAYGHAAGDEILIETVRLLRSVIRPSDRVCRIGGDEFVVIFHQPEGPRDPSSKPPSDVEQIAQRFQREICAQRFPKLGREAPASLTISGGLATCPWDGRTAAELLARADALAIECKRQGKNAIRMGPGVDLCA